MAEDGPWDLQIHSLVVRRWPRGRAVVVEFEVSTERPTRAETAVTITAGGDRSIVTTTRRIRYREHDLIQLPFDLSGDDDEPRTCSVRISPPGMAAVERSVAIDYSASEDSSRGV